jgi:hypothetical protein
MTDSLKAALEKAFEPKIVVQIESLDGDGKALERVRRLVTATLSDWSWLAKRESGKVILFLGKK